MTAETQLGREKGFELAKISVSSPCSCMSVQENGPVRLGAMASFRLLQGNVSYHKPSQQCCRMANSAFSNVMSMTYNDL